MDNAYRKRSLLTKRYIKLKTAIIHDWLTTFGGAEKVLESIYELFPSPIYTLVKDEEVLKGSILEEAEIHTSFIQKLPKAKTKYRNYLILFPLAIEQFDLSDYDVIISSSHAVAKGVLVNSNQLHICYCHTPIRYAWDLYHEYLRNLKGIKSIAVKLVLHYLRIWDVTTANRVDYFIANSKYVAKRIKKVYGREAVVIYPPVDIEKFEVSTSKENFYLTVGRLVPYKRVDLIVKAFSMMPDKKLIVIGTGPDYRRIKKLATKNVEVLGYQPFETLRSYMQKAKAFIIAAEEDFGIAPVEAQACGTPVILYGKGGATEAIIEGKTGVTFKEQTVESLMEAVKNFERIENKLFDPLEIRKNAERFSKERFKKELKTFIEESLKNLRAQKNR